MKVHILDDWFDTLRTLPCFSLLEGHDTTVWTDHEPVPVRLSARVADAEALILFRERTKIGAELLERLPNLKLISQRSVYPHVDVPACSDNGVLLCSNMHSGIPSYAAAEHTLALILSSYRQIPDQVASIRAGNWQSGVGRTLRGKTLGLYGFGRIGGAVAEYAKAIGMKVQWWSSEAGRARAIAAGESVPASRDAFFATSDIVSLHVRLKPATRVIITYTDLPEEDNYYVFDFGFGEYFASEDTFYQDQQFSFSYFYDEENVEVGTEVTVSILGADAEFYNYMNQLIEQSDDGFNPFQTPTLTVRGNFINATDIDNDETFDNVGNENNFALGYFALVQVFSESLVIEEL